MKKKLLVLICLLISFSLFSDIVGIKQKLLVENTFYIKEIDCYIWECYFVTDKNEKLLVIVNTTANAPEKLLDTIHKGKYDIYMTIYYDKETKNIIGRNYDIKKSGNKRKVKVLKKLDQLPSFMLNVIFDGKNT